jgi:REP element-mobilizing transposase RayT
MRIVDRTDEPNAVWHITSRVNWRAWHLEPEGAANTFLECLGDSAERFGVDLKADVVMSNHYHLVAQSPGEDLYRELTGRRTRNRHFRPWPAAHPKSTVIGQFIRAVKLKVAKSIQGGIGLSGHFWEGRHHRRRLHDEWAMVIAVAYDHRNPVKEGMVARAEDYDRSSAGWWTNGSPSAVPLCRRSDFPFGVTLETFRAHLIRLQREKALDGVMERFQRSGLPIDSVRGRAYLEKLLKEAGLDPLAGESPCANAGALRIPQLLATPEVTPATQVNS